VKVKVVEIDEKRKRIALTMRLTTEAAAQGTQGIRGTPSGQGGQRNRNPEQSRKPEQSGGRKEQRIEQATRSQQQKQKQKSEAQPNTAMAAAFAKLKR
jgi:uncharacterized protein